MEKSRVGAISVGAGLATITAEWFINSIIQLQQGHIERTPNVVNNQIRQLPTWLKFNENIYAGYALLAGTAGLAALVITTLWTQCHKLSGTKEEKQPLLLNKDEDRMQTYMKRLEYPDFNLNAVLQLAVAVLSNQNSGRALRQWENQKEKIIRQCRNEGRLNNLHQAASKIDPKNVLGLHKEPTSEFRFVPLG